MPLQPSPVVVWPRMWNQSSAAVHTLDAAGEKLGFIFSVGKTGNISKLVIRCGAVTTAETLKLSLQDVDLSTGEPDETEDQSGTFTPVVNDWVEVTLGSSRAVTVGDLLAVVIEFDSTVGDVIFGP